MIEAARKGSTSTLAACLTAHRIHVARLAAGRDDEPTEEAQAGAVLEAHQANDLRALVEALPGIVKAMKVGG